MSFWVYVIGRKGEIVAAADTRITWTNETGQNVGSTEDGLKILDISNKYSKAFILVTGYKFWYEGFENSVVSYLNSIPDHTASNIAEYLNNFPFKGNCYLGIICSSQQTRASCYNLAVFAQQGQVPIFSQKNTGNIINEGTDGEFYFADSSDFINGRPDLNLLSSLAFIPFGESFIGRAKGALEGIIKAYSNPLINSDSHRYTVSDVADVITINQENVVRAKVATKDETPFFPGPFNRQPVPTAVEGRPANLVDTESVLMGLKPPGMY